MPPLPCLQRFASLAAFASYFRCIARCHFDDASPIIDISFDAVFQFRRCHAGAAPFFDAEFSLADIFAFHATPPLLLRHFRLFIFAATTLMPMPLSFFHFRCH